ncbi:helix-turn-helix transcriptional regulator [Serratia sp. UGAL515B_01]|uniref:XRE family transcriptional regulator n=1 Tax=Serratia sp. UGAL515B_01 TaxID=2986763 RepID=UPI002954C359|nr:helix-turn-helix transcriptional regulator [Serratia sp. UGAL515B_01]WON77551.1 helix-turn-helix transcriptional regulator [Serratia sp. UGAL515B_01]
MTFSKRLEIAMKESGYTQGSLAKAVGMAQSSVWKLVSGGAQGSRKIVDIAKVLGVRPEWLSDGSEPMRIDGAHPLPVDLALSTESDFYRVDVLDIQASAGPGTFVSTDFIERIRAIEYTNEQAASLFGNRPADTVKLITVRGDSMEGTINPGDDVFVDMAVTQFDGDGIYVFVFGNTLHIKRLQMQGNKLIVISDNQRYRDWHISQSDEDQFFIMAKVLLRQSIDYKRFW